MPTTGHSPWPDAGGAPAARTRQQSNVLGLSVPWPQTALGGNNILLSNAEAIGCGFQTDLQPVQARESWIERPQRLLDLQSTNGRATLTPSLQMGAIPLPSMRPDGPSADAATAESSTLPSPPRATAARQLQPPIDSVWLRLSQESGFTTSFRRSRSSQQHRQPPETEKPARKTSKRYRRRSSNLRSRSRSLPHSHSRPRSPSRIVSPRRVRSRSMALPTTSSPAVSLAAATTTTGEDPLAGGASTVFTRRRAVSLDGGAAMDRRRSVLRREGYLSRRLTTGGSSCRFVHFPTDIAGDGDDDESADEEGEERMGLPEDRTAAAATAVVGAPVLQRISLALVTADVAAALHAEAEAAAAVEAAAAADSGSPEPQASWEEFAQPEGCDAGVDVGGRSSGGDGDSGGVDGDGEDDGGAAGAGAVMGRSRSASATASALCALASIEAGRLTLTSPPSLGLPTLERLRKSSLALLHSSLSLAVQTTAHEACAAGDASGDPSRRTSSIAGGDGNDGRGAKQRSSIFSRRRRSSHTVRKARSSSHGHKTLEPASDSNAVGNDTAEAAAPPARRVSIFRPTPPPGRASGSAATGAGLSARTSRLTSVGRKSITIAMPEPVKRASEVIRAPMPTPQPLQPIPSVKRSSGGSSDSASRRTSGAASGSVPADWWQMEEVRGDYKAWLAAIKGMVTDLDEAMAQVRNRLHSYFARNKDGLPSPRHPGLPAGLPSLENAAEVVVVDPVQRSLLAQETALAEHRGSLEVAAKCLMLADIASGGLMQSGGPGLQSAGVGSAGVGSAGGAAVRAPGCLHAAGGTAPEKHLTADPGCCISSCSNGGANEGGEPDSQNGNGSGRGGGGGDGCGGWLEAAARHIASARARAGPAGGRAAAAAAVTAALELMPPPLSPSHHRPGRRSPTPELLQQALSLSGVSGMEGLPNPITALTGGRSGTAAAAPALAGGAAAAAGRTVQGGIAAAGAFSDGGTQSGGTRIGQVFARPPRGDTGNNTAYSTNRSGHPHPHVTAQAARRAHRNSSGGSAGGGGAGAGGGGSSGGSTLAAPDLHPAYLAGLISAATNAAASATAPGDHARSTRGAAADGLAPPTAAAAGGHAPPTAAAAAGHAPPAAAAAAGHAPPTAAAAAGHAPPTGVAGAARAAAADEVETRTEKRTQLSRPEAPCPGTEPGQELGLGQAISSCNTDALSLWLSTKTLGGFDSDLGLELLDMLDGAGGAGGAGGAAEADRAGGADGGRSSGGAAAVDTNPTQGALSSFQEFILQRRQAAAAAAGSSAPPLPHYDPFWRPAQAAPNGGAPAMYGKPPGTGPQRGSGGGGGDRALMGSLSRSSHGSDNSTGLRPAMVPERGCRTDGQRQSVDGGRQTHTLGLRSRILLRRQAAGPGSADSTPLASALLADRSGLAGSGGSGGGACSSARHSEGGESCSTARGFRAGSAGDAVPAGTAGGLLCRRTAPGQAPQATYLTHGTPSTPGRNLPPTPPLPRPPAAPGATPPPVPYRRGWSASRTEGTAAAGAAGCCNLPTLTGPGAAAAVPVSSGATDPRVIAGRPAATRGSSYDEALQPQTCPNSPHWTPTVGSPGQQRVGVAAVSTAAAAGGGGALNSPEIGPRRRGFSQPGSIDSYRGGAANGSPRPQSGSTSGPLSMTVAGVPALMLADQVPLRQLPEGPKEGAPPAAPKTPAEGTERAAMRKLSSTGVHGRAFSPGHGARFSSDGVAVGLYGWRPLR